jgi:hypothetical protein
VLAPGYDGIITWPSCLLHKVCDDGIFGLPLIRQTFPMAWSELKPLAQKQTKQHQLQLLTAPLAAQPHTPNPFPVDGRRHCRCNWCHRRPTTMCKLGGRIPMKKIWG